MALFPLPLVPFEHYMLADDRADYPNSSTQSSAVAVSLSLNVMCCYKDPRDLINGKCF